MTGMCPILGPNSLRVLVLLFFCAKDLKRSLFSKSAAYNSHKHASHCLALSLSTYFDNKLHVQLSTTVWNLWYYDLIDSNPLRKSYTSLHLVILPLPPLGIGSVFTHSWGQAVTIYCTASFSTTVVLEQ